jgi:hypothetical protein
MDEQRFGVLGEQIIETGDGLALDEALTLTCQVARARRSRLKCEYASQRAPLAQARRSSSFQRAGTRAVFRPYRPFPRPTRERLWTATHRPNPGLRSPVPPPRENRHALDTLRCLPPAEGEKVH